MIGRRADDARAFDEALSGRAPRDTQIAELVRFAENLCETAVVEPSPEFRGSLRTLLMTEAETALVRTVKSPRPATAPTLPSRAHNVRRRVAGLTAAVLASVGAVGLVSSSASAVPGEMLYPVKRGVESVELALHRDDASRGSFQLSRASERLAEARELADDPSANSGARVAATLDDFTGQAGSGSTSLFNAFGDNGELKSIQQVNDFAASASAQLAALSGLLPDSADSSFHSAAHAISKLVAGAATLCPSCSTTDIQALVNAITGFSKASVPDKPAHTSTSPSDSDTDAPTASGSSTPTPAPTPVVVLPAPLSAPAPTPEPVTLGTVTDPLIGALLGDHQ